MKKIGEVLQRKHRGFLRSLSLMLIISILSTSIGVSPLHAQEGEGGGVKNPASPSDANSAFISEEDEFRDLVFFSAEHAGEEALRNGNAAAAQNEEMARRDYPDALEAEGFRYIEDNGEVVIVGLAEGNTDTEIQIPDTLAGMNVREIADHAFYFENLSKVVLGANLIRIGNYALTGNQLEEIGIPDRLEHIGNHAFRDNQIKELDLNHLKFLGEYAFTNNKIESLMLGDALEEIGKEAFRNNDIRETEAPDTLRSLGEDVFSYNRRYVRVRVGAVQNIPAFQKREGGYGYVVNPVRLKLSFIDAESGAKLLDDQLLGENLQNESEIFALGAEQRYEPPQIEGYILDMPNEEGFVLFTPDAEEYSLEIRYRLHDSGLVLKQDPSKSLRIDPNTADIERVLRELVIAQNAAGEDLRASVEINPSTIDTSAEGRTYDISYLLRGEGREVKYLNLRVYVGQDMSRYPLGNDWVLGDFVYGGDPGNQWESRPSVVNGLSEQGKLKAQTNKDLVLPHINPRTGDRILEASSYNHDKNGFYRFSEKGFRSIRDFDGNIKKLGWRAFESSDLREVVLPNLEEIGERAFYNNPALEEFDFSKIKKIDMGGFWKSGIKSVKAPNLVNLGTYVFYQSAVGSDPDDPQAVYMPKITDLASSTFRNAKLTYVDDTMFPNLTVIQAEAFASNQIEKVSLSKVNKVGNNAFHYQNNRALTEIYLPEATEIGQHGFSYNSVERLSLPKVKLIKGEAFRDNKLKELDLPLLEEMQGNAVFAKNLLEVLRLPSLLRAKGESNFEDNKIREAYLDRVEELGPYFFKRSYHVYNPGLQALDGQIPVYTQNLLLPSRENYIVNPSSGSGGAYTEEDFTWAPDMPDKVTGFTTQGKTKFIANGFHLTLPDRAKIVGAYAFNTQQVKSVSGKNVTEVEKFAFRWNPLSKADFPELVIVREAAFANNSAEEGARLTKFNFEKINLMEGWAFYAAGLEGELSIPLMGELLPGTFEGNRISKVNAPILKKAQRSAFSGNELSSIDREQFPQLEHVDYKVFESNPVKKIDLPGLKFSYGHYEYNFKNVTEPVHWVIPQGISSQGNNKQNYGANTFAYYHKVGRDDATLMPGALIFTSPLRADGSLDRSNPQNYKEGWNNASYHHAGKWVNTKYRRAVINPGTVLVRYRIESGESFDGQEDRPLIPDYREYIYEELEGRIRETGAFSPNRIYHAPQVPGYVLVKTEDASGNVSTIEKTIALPFEPEGARTDRSIIFTYRKVEISPLEGPNLTYGVRRDPADPLEHSMDYTVNHPGSTTLFPQMLTFFSIDSLKVPIKKGKIKITYDTPYIDAAQVNVSQSAATDVWYRADAWSSQPGGLEIRLNENISAASSIRDVAISYRFKNGFTPDEAKTKLEMVLTDEDENGNEVIIAKAPPVELGLIYQPKPRLTMESPLNLPGYDYRGMTAASNAPRAMGRLVDAAPAEGYKVANDPEPVMYAYKLDQIYYLIDGVELETLLPEYTAIDEQGNETVKKALFDPALNPGWELSEDGNSVRFTRSLEPMMRLDWINRSLPKLYLKFPGLKEKSSVETRSFAKIRQYKDPAISGPESKKDAGGDLGIGDALIMQALYHEPRLYTGEDTSLGKTHAFLPRSLHYSAYLYDHEEDRKKDIPYRLSLRSSNEISDYRNVSVFDYDLDERLYYKQIKFEQTPNEAGNATVLISAYKKVGQYMDPQNDSLVFERETAIDKSRALSFPNLDIDYIRIRLLSTSESALNKELSFLVIAGVKDKSSPLLDGSGGDKQLKNKAVFVADHFKKGTDTPMGERNPDPEFAALGGNSAIVSEAQVNILEYKLSMGVEKSLFYKEAPEMYRRYPSFASGELVLEGEKGAYHIRLNPVLSGNPADMSGTVLKNLEIIDLLPNSIQTSRADIILDPLFIKAGGKVELIGNYPVKENGQNLMKNAIRFYSESFDTRYYKNHPLRIASIKTKYVGETLQEVLTNKVYASWDNPEIEVINPAKAENNTDLINPKGEPIDPAAQPWAYSEAAIRVASSSALSAKLYIKNRKDHLWTDKITTESEEKFDYRMVVSQFDRNPEITGYRGIDIINILPGEEDLRLNKQGIRGSEFSNEIDLERVGTDLRLPSGYRIEYYNTDAQIKDFLVGRSIDDFGNDASIIWSPDPAPNTKAIRIRAEAGTVLQRGEKLIIEIPMKAKRLSGNEDALIGKSGVDSFALRYYKRDTTEYSDFAEANLVENSMDVPKGSISFTKFGKEGRNTPDNQARALPGAGFEIAENSDRQTILGVVYSDQNGRVRFDGLAINKTYYIREFAPPEEYAISNNQGLVVDQSKFVKLAQGTYEVNIPDKDSKNAFMNVKPITGKLRLVKQSRDPSVLLPSYSFILKGYEATNQTVEQEISTGADGSLTVDNLPEGSYYVEELESPSANRYVRPPRQYFRIDAQKKEHELIFINSNFQVLFKKVVVEDENLLDPQNWDRLTDFGKKKLQGYRFKVRGEDGTSFTTGNTGGDGSVILSGLKTEVVYTVTEDEAQSSNLRPLYQHNPRQYRFKITHDGKLINAKNGERFIQYSLNFPNMPKKIKGKIIIRKTDQASTALEGAKFRISRMEFGENGELRSLVQVGEDKITSLNAQNKAEAVFENLDPGMYRIEEVLPPPGYYLLGDEKIDVRIPDRVVDSMANDSKYEKRGEEIIFTSEHTVKNRPITLKCIKGSDLSDYQNVDITTARHYVESKRAALPNINYRVTGNNRATVYLPLEGVVFELYRMENGQKTGAPIQIGGSSEIRSNEKGEIDFQNYPFEYDAVYGLVEKQGIGGYQKYEGIKTFSIREEALKSGFNGKISFYINNRKLEGSLLVSKYDGFNRVKLGGAVFQLFKGDLASADFTNVLQEKTTGEGGYALFSKLEPGSYVLREKSAPAGYMQPREGERDREIVISDQNLHVSSVFFNTKLINIPIRKQWAGGSEGSAKVRLMRSIYPTIGYTPVMVNGLTDASGAVELNAAGGWETVFSDMPLSREDGKRYYYKAEEFDLDKTLYRSTLTGNAENGFTITNTATAQNKVSIGVTKNWEFAGQVPDLQNAQVEVALKKVLSGNRIPVPGDASHTEEIERFTLNAQNHWQHTFMNLPKRENGRDIVYRVEEIGTPAGFEAEYAFDAANAAFTITNKAIKRDKIEVEKIWRGVSPDEAPHISIELYDAEDMTRSLAAAEPLRENGREIARFLDIPSFAYSMNEGGGIEARKIRYVLKEKYADQQEHPAYSTESGMNEDMFAEYSQDANLKNSLHAELINSMAAQDIIVEKRWEGIEPDAAPAVVLELLDVTADTSADLSDTASHIKLADISLDAVQGWSRTFASMPKYKPDGITPIRYALKEQPLGEGYLFRQNISRTEDGSLHLSMTNTRKKVKLKISKTWQMLPKIYENSDAEKPEVRLHLWADESEDGVYNPTEIYPIKEGVQLNPIVLNEGMNWSIELEDLPQYTSDGRQRIRYYVTEEANEGYEGSNAPLELRETGEANLLEGNILNRQIARNIHIEKRWEGLESYPEQERGELPAVSLKIYDSTDPQNPIEITERSIVLVKDNTDASGALWKANLINMPKYKADGSAEIIYTVKEVDASERPGYEVRYDPALIVDVNDLKFTITNQVRRRDILVRKSWIGKQESFVDVYLLKNGNRIWQNPTRIREQNAQTQDAWTHVFPALPYYEIDGRTPIRYGVEEVDTPGYSSSLIEAEEVVPGNTQQKRLSFELTNTFQTVDLYVEKQWEGVEPAQAPAVRIGLVNLKDENAPISLNNYNMQLDQSNGFKGVFRDLPKFEEDGVTPMKYGVEELAAQEGYQFTYKTEYSQEPGADSPFGSIHFKALNTRKRVKIKLKKNWLGGSSELAHPDVILHLWADDTDNGIEDPAEIFPEQEIRLRAAESWQKEYELPEYASDGITPISYYVSEDPISGYKTLEGKKRLDKNPASKALEAEITNLLLTRNILVEHEFLDLDLYKEEAKNRLPRLHVQVYDITEPDNPLALLSPKPLEKDADGKWRTSFASLPIFWQGTTREAIYQVKLIEEEEMKGYQTVHDPVRILPSADLEFILHSSPLKLPVYLEKEWAGIDPAAAPAAKFALKEKHSGGDIRLEGALLELSTANAWKGSFGELPLFAIDGKTPVEYELEELSSFAGYHLSQSITRDDAGIYLKALNTREEVKLHLRKSWADQYLSYERPEVELLLWKSSSGGEPYEAVLADPSAADNRILLNQRTGWSREIAHLPKYEKDGNTPIRYYVSETPIPGYHTMSGMKELMPSADKPGVLYAEIENSLMLVDIKVSNEWRGLDSYASAKKQPPIVHALLYDMTDETHPILLASKPIDQKTAGENIWETEFKGFAKYKEDGITPIRYKVIEKEEMEGSLPGYITSYSEAFTDEAGNLVFPIHNFVRLRRIEVNKIWRGGAESPAVEAYLSQGGDRISLSALAINGKDENGRRTETREPYYEIDGKTQRTYGLELYAKGDYKTRVSESQSLSDPSDEKHSDLLFEIRLFLEESGEGGGSTGGNSSAKQQYKVDQGISHTERNLDQNPETLSLPDPSAAEESFFDSRERKTGGAKERIGGNPPDTGDRSDVLRYVFFLILSLGASLLLFRKSRKQN
ncbi:MAG: Cna B-type domain-containing protein [Johnsonella sp.]|nr:Cna B-type domain-containing protein [Johnsonella sp.]